ncbi:helix-turn-helix domain-containing protein [Nicoliella spurrieriana]|uniref:Helix-turn-helix domain-containing protein n=1 Tax=Nicoliella spurrieriana TaxID=2925830 RepID=A0A976RRS5_9LACO|nr:helix-turn-helix domain-containing protein [Nicoliella spurrieriana]UQS86560.1 helix-turn-helix domain-containing protein [Nicoliella spurrieriana]
MDQDLIMFFLSAEQPRRIKVIENTLIQRRTVSTLFWGMRYQINDFMGLSPKLNSINTNHELVKLIQAGLVTKNDDSHYRLTSLGTARIHTHQPYFSSSTGLSANANYNLLQFRKRWLLALQITSEYSYRNQHYYPMLIGNRDDSFIKQWFHHFKNHGLVNEIKRGLNHFLSQLPNDLAWQFVKRLNGHSMTGMTLLQQSAVLKRTTGSLLIDEWYLFDNLIIFLLNHQSQYPACYDLLMGTHRDQVSNSARQTYQFFLQNNHLKLIANYRKLRLSTVKEHLLEVAILDFKTHAVFKQMFDRNTWQLLGNLYHGNLDNWQFDRIKQQRPDFDYFYFRMYQILRSNQDG